jgi:hypothetical protein
MLALSYDPSGRNGSGRARGTVQWAPSRSASVRPRGPGAVGPTTVGWRILPADDAAVHHVEPRAAPLRPGVAVGERVARGGIAHDRVRGRAVPEEDARGLEQVRADLDDLGPSRLEVLVPSIIPSM